MKGREGVLRVIKVLVHHLGEHVVTQLKQDAIAATGRNGALRELEDVRSTRETFITEDGGEGTIQSSW